MNIGIYSGSFNPVHIAHVMLGNYIVEYTDIDEVWFLLTPQNPLKNSAYLLDENVRFEMLKLALAKYDKLKASDFELSLPRPSYTINTLNALRETYSDDAFTLIIGADNWSVFDTWKDHSQILADYQLKVYPRLGSRISIHPKMRNNVEALDSPIVDVSSSFIRDGISADKNMQAFLVEDVYEYIVTNNLYR